MGEIQFLNDDEKQTLLNVAQESVTSAVRSGAAMKVDLADYSGALVEKGASFVTLNKSGQLRGCIGSLLAWRPLVEDVAANAMASALRDPRFPPVSPSELPLLSIHISVLTPSEPMDVADEEALLRQLEPGRDGLIISYKDHRATFLPAVWEQLPDPKDFVAHLKVKAGLPVDFWDKGIRCDRYRAISIP